MSAIGRKISMTSISTRTGRILFTYAVIEAGPCVVTQNQGAKGVDENSL
jgi:ribosomal protein L3